MDVEAKAREIVEQARRERARPSRAMWIWALVIATVCIAALVIGYVTRTPAQPGAHQPASDPAAGFGTGLLVGLVAGIAIGTAYGLHRRHRS